MIHIPEDPVPIQVNVKDYFEVHRLPVLQTVGVGRGTRNPFVSGEFRAAGDCRDVPGLPGWGEGVMAMQGFDVEWGWVCGETVLINLLILPFC